MHNLSKLFFSFLFVLLLAQTGHAQNSAIADSIDNQFEEILKTSNNFQDYKVIKLYKVTDLRNATIKEINELSEKIDNLNEKNEKQTLELSKLENQLSETNAKLEKSEKTKDEFTWLGMQINKTSYQSVMYGIIVILVLILLFFIFKYKKNMSETSEAKKNLNQLQREFDEYRQKALETQQKLGRQLQDEKMRNSNRETGGQ